MAPHIALREAGIEHSLARITVAQKENFSQEYLRINPRGRVPALVVGDQVFTEAPALLIYVASLNPQAGLLPENGSPELARTLEWLAWISSTLHVAYAQVWRPERFLTPEMDAAPFTEEGKVRAAKLSYEVEARLGDAWAVDDKFTVADAYLLPFYRWGNRVGIEMRQRYPRWNAWVQKITKRPAVRDVIEIEGIGYDQFDLADG